MKTILILAVALPLAAQSFCLDGSGPLAADQERCNILQFSVTPLLLSDAHYTSLILLDCFDSGPDCGGYLGRQNLTLSFTLEGDNSCSTARCAFIEFHDKDYWWAYRVDDEDHRWIEQSELELRR